MDIAPRAPLTGPRVAALIEIIGLKLDDAEVAGVLALAGPVYAAVDRLDAILTIDSEPASIFRLPAE